MLKYIKTKIENSLGIKVYKKIPHGVDLFSDIKRLLPKFKVTTVFDVGANVGQSVNQIHSSFPSAIFYCFEPEKENFERLRMNTQRLKHIHYNNVALGDTKESRNLILEGPCEMYYLADDLHAHSSSENIVVPVDTIDAFCESANISSISFLKIDTEGYDLNVLRGAAMTLNQQQIDILQVEVGMNKFNDRHVDFCEMKTFLEEKNYYLFGVYEQVNEWPASKANLRRVNAAFISTRVINLH